MSTRPSRLVRVLASALALVGATAAAANAAPGDPLDPRTYAPQSEPYLAVFATGVQKYRCQSNGTWLFTDPEATLFTRRGRKPIGTHYLNFATGRPVWRYLDGSSVEAARTASLPGDVGAIPLLLLQAVATTGGGELSETTWVQRLETSGGIAPAGACAPGATAAVPYSTDYVFWRATGA